MANEDPIKGKIPFGDSRIEPTIEEIFEELKVIRADIDEILIWASREDISAIEPYLKIAEKCISEAIEKLGEYDNVK